MTHQTPTYCFFDDVEAFLVYFKGRHLLNDLLQQNVLFVAVTFDRQLRQTQTGDGRHVTDADA